MMGLQGRSCYGIRLTNNRAF